MCIFISHAYLSSFCILVASGTQALPQTGDQSAAQQPEAFDVFHCSVLSKTELKNQNKPEKLFALRIECIIYKNNLYMPAVYIILFL